MSNENKFSEIIRKAVKMDKNKLSAETNYGFEKLEPQNFQAMDNPREVMAKGGSVNAIFRANTSDRGLDPIKDVKTRTLLDNHTVQSMDNMYLSTVGDAAGLATTNASSLTNNLKDGATITKALGLADAHASGAAEMFVEEEPLRQRLAGIEQRLPYIEEGSRKNGC